MADAPAAPFRRIAILGTGLIGGSFGFAVRKRFPEVRVVGWDKEEVLQQAAARGAIHEGISDLPRALSGADLAYLALPIGLTLDLLPEIAGRVEPTSLVTDSCSTKRAICAAAEKHFCAAARFLGGHPMVGKEVAGVAHADGELFRGAKYALTGERSANGSEDSRIRKFLTLLESIGARPIWLDPEIHDWAVAIISHLPQMVSVALAGVVREETDETGLPMILAGSGLRDALRLAGSPYPMWRDVALTNTDNLARALDRMAQAIEDVRLRLASRELEDEFAAANELYKMLREL
jgi:prephenate dehydrogenase